MKLVGIVGSIAPDSYNRKLLEFMARHFKEQVNLEVLDIADVPVFCEDNDQTDSTPVQELKNKIEEADGVVIATPEHNHTLTGALKNTLEWLSWKIHPLADKPVLVVGASYFDQGSSRAQLDLRQILEAPGVNALVMPGNEFLLGNVREAFDENGDLVDERTTAFLGTVLDKFIRWVSVLAALKGPDTSWQDEDLSASEVTDTTIDVPVDEDDWLEKAAEKTKAASGDDYVKLDAGILTVNQLNWFLKAIPAELTFVDETNQFLYYNKAKETGEMFAKRKPEDVGQPLGNLHHDQGQIHSHVKQVIHNLRTGKESIHKLSEPIDKVNEKWVVNNYCAMHDEDGNYRGINEVVLDYWPIVKTYLEMTGQTLIKDPLKKGWGAGSDAVGSASQSGSDDATASASQSGTTNARPQVQPDLSVPQVAPAFDDLDADSKLGSFGDFSEPSADDATASPSQQD